MPNIVVDAIWFIGWCGLVFDGVVLVGGFILAILRSFTAFGGGCLYFGQFKLVLSGVISCVGFLAALVVRGL